MKKVLGIVVLVLLCNVGFAEEIKMKCIGKNIFNGNTEIENYVVDLDKKAIHLVPFGPENAFPIIITKDFFLKYEYQEKLLLKDYYEISYREWDRNNGKNIDYLIVVEKKDLNVLKKKLNKENDKVKKANIYKKFIEEIFPKEPANPFQFALYKADCTFN